MKKIVFISFFIYIYVFGVQAQDTRFIFEGDSIPEEFQTVPDPVIPSKGDSLSKIPPKVPAWNIDRRFGDRIVIEMDTLMHNFHQTSLIDGKDIAVSYLGNWGSAAQSMIYFNRDEPSQFPFLDAFSYYYKRPDNQRFLNTKIPYSNIMYQSGGSRQSKEERFTGDLSISYNKNFSIGFDIDYVYSRGYFQYLSNKQLNYDFFASYIGDRYQMHAFIGNNSFTNSENGGIVDPKYLSGNAENSQIDKNQTLNFPTRFSDTWNRVRGLRLYMTNKYDLGYDKEENSTFVPVASVILTTDYTDQKRKFYSNMTDSLDHYYNYIPAEGQAINASVLDKTSFFSFKNTFALRLNEGFRDWVKFGLTAFIEQDFRKYSLPTENFTWLFNKEYSQSSTVIGGVLSKEKGKFLKYNLSADFGVLGYNLGESNFKADITTTVNVKGKDAYIRANGYIKNIKPTFYQNNYQSKYYNWVNDFSDIRKVYIGGEIFIPHTKTKISGGIENIDNYIYYAYNPTEKRPNIYQHSGNIQVVSLQLDQKMSVGILHWDNQVAFQTTTEEDVIPLPKLSLYTNLYINVTLAKVLKMQLGVDAHYFSKYYAPGYDPALLQFYNQNNLEIGNFPFATAYANLQLKKTRFFLMMYNVAKSMGDSQYMTTPYYPVNPMLFKFGLSWNFNN